MKLRAERKLGELLGEMEKAKGQGVRGEDGKFYQRSRDVTAGDTPTYSDFGISKMQAEMLPPPTEALRPLLEQVHPR